jgi:hypothetical protein
VDDEAHRRRILVQLNRHEKRHEPDVGVDFVVDDDASVVESYGGHRVAHPLGVLMVAGGAVLLAVSLLGGKAPGMEAM